ncbi:MAG: ornithine cyclodeaminase family protein [Pseudomonadota bacterium]
MNSHTIPHLTASQLDELDLRAQNIIDILQRLIGQNSEGKVWSAPKAVITPPDGRYVMATLALMDEPPLVATKSLVLNDNNRKQGLPQINGLVTVLDGENGIPLATIDGNWITGIRTAGLSAVAAHHLARNDAKSVAFIGTGVQAHSHLQLFAQMFPLELVRILGRGQKNIDLLAEFATSLGLASEICTTPEQAVPDSDLVVSSVTHTSLSEPILSAEWLSPGSFASSVELGVAWDKSSFKCLDILCIDDLEQEAVLPNKLADPDDVSGDLAGLIGGKTPARTNTTEKTAFVFRGHALGDLALAALAYLAHADRST